MKFEKITKEILIDYKEYFKKQNYKMADYSIGYKFMWRNYADTYVACENNTLIFKEHFEGKTYFHYPLSLTQNIDDEIKALDLIENYCLDNELSLNFTCVPKEVLPYMISRYGFACEIANRRRWRDYLYLVDNFENYAGGKFSGQRNHVNKFKTKYPNYKFVKIDINNINRVKEFFKEYEEIFSKKQFSNKEIADEEFVADEEIMPLFFDFDFIGGFLCVDEKIVAVSIGEICGDTLIVHIEKALTEYEGAYPTIAQEFAKNFTLSDIKFVNREDDAGEIGLRKSKLQYKPLEILPKYDIFIKTEFDKINSFPTLKGERVTLCELKEKDFVEYAKMCMDEKRNEYWGYDWKEEFYKNKNKSLPTPDYFVEVMKNDFENKIQIPFMIYDENDEFIGEADMHRFDYKEGVEVGVRLLENFEGQGYAQEAIKLLIHYALFDLDLNQVNAKCYKQNVRSRKMLESSGLRYVKEDETYFYFYKTAEM